MFPDFQQLVLTFQEISRERVEGFFNDNLSSFKDKMRSAKVIVLHHVFASVYQFTFLNKSFSLSLCTVCACVLVYPTCMYKLSRCFDVRDHADVAMG
jgi:hypothetical protein